MRSIAALILLCFMASCANIVAPTGGQLDKTAPSILQRSSPDSVLNFKGGKISYTFDEFIQIKDINNQLTVSPLLNPKPIITVKKKTLTIEIIDTSLRANTTYFLSLGNAVRDIHEDNIYNNLNFTFSTGSYYDSLQLNGNIRHAPLGIMDTGFVVMLYSATTPDTQLLITPPLYSTRSVLGGFQFTSLPAGPLKLVALQDKDKNSLYAPGERIAFSKELYFPQQMKKDSVVKLISFAEINNNQPSGRLSAGRKGRDTLMAIKPDGNSLSKWDKRDSLIIKFSDTIKTWDANKIILYEDSIIDLTSAPQWDSARNIIYYTPNWKIGSQYMIVTTTGYAANEKSTLGIDTIKFTSMKENDYGTLLLTVDSALITPQSQIQIFRGTQLISTELGIKQEIKIPFLKPGSYRVVLHNDTNNNGIWDTGNWKLQQQPENTLALEPDVSIKANWENKIEWNYKSGGGKRK